MLSATILALILGLAGDAQTSPPVAVEAPPQRPSWTEHWAVSVSTGRTFYDSAPNDPDSSGIWRLSHRQSEIRLTHQGAPLVVGVSLHRIAYPAGPDRDAIGGGLVLGAHHLLLSWLYAELDVTLGLQRPSRLVAGPTVDRPPGVDGGGSGDSGATMQTGTFNWYAGLGAGVALRVASWLEMPARLNLTMQPMGKSRSLVAASVGLRCLLP
jgi:hypothetical protein